MSTVSVRRPAADLATRATVVATEIAGPAADDVDRQARFPVETVAALRSEGMLSALVPARLGGDGATLAEVGAATAALARQCASSAMVYAMHNLQVACLARHGATEHLEGYLRDLAGEQYLLASATTEIGTGGDTRSSVCAVTHAGGRYRVEKQAPVISYGEHADAVLVTARRAEDSPPSDQVLVLASAPDVRLRQISGWDTLGLRGTCSSGYVLTAEGGDENVLPVPFADISTRTMLPVSHVLWGHVWLGIAAEAFDRARRSVQAEARKHPGTTPPAALRLAELATLYDQMAALVEGAARAFDEIAGDEDALDRMSFAARMNSLKVSASTMVVDVVGAALGICGINAYRQDSPASMGRLLRDAYGASLMVNNDRILANNAQLLLMNRGTR
ncbi:MAG: acyl-CoA dehydrogenase family protein [Acidimicrobiales bacterium]